MAAALEEIPIIGSLVKTFQFGAGGVRTDGISTQPSTNGEKIIINFSNHGEMINQVPSYTIEKKVAPYRIVCNFSGVRYFQYEQFVEEANQISGVKQVYRIITLGDSEISFVIELEEDMDYEIFEYEDPGRIEISLQRKESTPYQVYYLKSESMMQGEALSNLRDEYAAEGASIVQTSKGDYCVVIGEYTTKEEAIRELEKLKKQKDSSDIFSIGNSASNEYP